MQKNVPDRIKLILQLIVFTLGTWLLIVLILLFSGAAYFLRDYFDFDRKFLVELLIGAFVLQGWRFFREWKKLIREEAAGHFPDMQDPVNIKPFQIIFIILGIMLLVTGYTCFQMYSKFAGALCFVAIFVLGAVEKIYIKRKS